MFQASALRVLIVDDCVHWRTALNCVLQAEGFEVLNAADGLEGVRMARQQRPDVILMDLHMPRMDGWEAMAALHADPGTAPIPVLVTSSESPCPERLHEVGACCSIGKVSRPERLIASIRSCIVARRRQLIAEKVGSSGEVAGFGVARAS